jgi:hypothetical protein
VLQCLKLGLQYILSSLDIIIILIPIIIIEAGVGIGSIPAVGKQ